MHALCITWACFLPYAEPTCRQLLGQVLKLLLAETFPGTIFQWKLLSSLRNWTKKNCSGLLVISKRAVKHLLKKSRSKLIQLGTNQNQGHLYWSSLKISFVPLSYVAPKASWIQWSNENAMIFFPPVFFFSILSKCHSLIKGCQRHRELPRDNRHLLLDKCWGEDKQEGLSCKC